MPLYVYAVVNDDGSDGEAFEVLQDMSEPPLTHHPETGRPVRRVFGTPSAGRAGASDGQLDRLGFTKYVKSGKGTYEKRAGKGPDVISRE